MVARQKHSRTERMHCDQIEKRLQALPPNVRMLCDQKKRLHAVSLCRAKAMPGMHAMIDSGEI